MSISGIVPSRYGEITFLGAPIHQMSPDRIFALRIAHRGYVMESGVITLQDTAANLLNSEKVKQAYLGL